MDEFDMDRCKKILLNNGYTEDGVLLSESEEMNIDQVRFLNWVVKNKDKVLSYIKEQDEYYSKMIIILEKKEEKKRNYMSMEDEFKNSIARVYFDEYSPKINCEIFTEILCGTEPEEILEKYGMSGNFNDMLQFRKYVKSLPKKYRKGLTKINDKIREIDETAIDGFRGSVSVEEISEELEQEGKLDGRSVMQVLKDQEDMQKMNERADIIDEQLRIAEEYGLEDY